jgi:uncharacterized protein (TIRG00374 family)
MSEDNGDPPRPASVTLRYTRHTVLLLVGAVALYFVMPSVLEVFSAWDDVSTLGWGWLTLTVACQAASFWCIWALQRLALRTRHWEPVITSQLAGNAASRLIPGGGATGATVQFSLLRSAGIDAAPAASGLAAVSILQLGTTLALPIVALPGIVFGAPVDSSLVHAAWIGAVIFVALFALVIVALVRDAPLEAAGRTVGWLRNTVVRHGPRWSGTGDRFVAERDSAIGALGDRWRYALALAVGRSLFDYLTLLVALRAVGAEPRVSLVLLAYAAGALLTLTPITPGGLGFVEAGLTGTLALAGIGAGAAVSASLLYRLASFWLPIPVGIVAGVTHGVRYRRANGRTISAQD